MVMAEPSGGLPPLQKRQQEDEAADLINDRVEEAMSKIRRMLGSPVGTATVSVVHKELSMADSIAQMADLRPRGHVKLP